MFPISIVKISTSFTKILGTILVVTVILLWAYRLKSTFEHSGRNFGNFTLVQVSVDFSLRKFHLVPLEGYGKIMGGKFNTHEALLILPFAHFIRILWMPCPFLNKRYSCISLTSVGSGVPNQVKRKNFGSKILFRKINFMISWFT